MPGAPEEFTLTGMLRGFARDRPHAPALSTADGAATLSFADVDARSSAVTHGLLARGVRAGDRVAVLDRNAPTFYDVLFGAAKIGAVTVGLNFRLAPPEIAAVVAEAAPRLVFAAPDLVHLVPAGTDVIEFGAGYEQWLAGQASGEDGLPADPTSDDVALLLYSSGTTGRPKGTMITHGSLGWTVRMGREHYDMSTDSVNLVPSPLFHIGGVGYALTTMGQGGHTVLVRDVDAAVLLRAMQRFRVTHTFLVPAVVQMLTEHPDLAGTDLSALRRVAYGAAPMGEAALLRAMHAFGCDFMGVYGMTETAGTVVTLAPGDHDPGGPRAGLLRSVGRPLPWVSLRVVDPATGTDAPPDAVGEIWVRSPQNMAGYWEQPQLTADVLVDGDWLRTGDAAYRDAAGFVFMHDRIKDMIVSGGENVYPAEVENVLGAHPDVLELAVIGVPSERWGETVKAMVVPRAGASVAEADLIAWTRERLAHYKSPTSINFVDELPRTPSGKVRKDRLRAPFWTPSDHVAPRT